jgi:hypothetical protein
MKIRGATALGAACAVLTLVLGALAPASADRTIARGRVPAPVLAAFAKAWPKAVAREYAREVEGGATFYEIESVEDSVTRDVLFKPDGTVVETEMLVPVSALPFAAGEAVRAMKPPVTLRTIEKVTRGTTIAYEVHGVQGGKRVELTFDASGKRTQ